MRTLEATMTVLKSPVKGQSDNRASSKTTEVRGPRTQTFVELAKKDSVAGASSRKRSVRSTHSISNSVRRTGGILTKPKKASTSGTVASGDGTSEQGGRRTFAIAGSESMGSAALDQREQSVISKKLLKRNDIKFRVCFLCSLMY